MQGRSTLYPQGRPLTSSTDAIALEKEGGGLRPCPQGWSSWSLLHIPANEEEPRQPAPWPPGRGTRRVVCWVSLEEQGAVGKGYGDRAPARPL